MLYNIIVLNIYLFLYILILKHKINYIFILFMMIKNKLSKEEF